MIYINNKEPIALYIGSRAISSVYFRGYKIWPIGSTPVTPDLQDIMSCFSGGYWHDEYPWTDNQPWTN